MPRVFIQTCLVVLLLFSGCVLPPSSTDSLPESPAENNTDYFFGRIVDENGDPVAEANIQSGDDIVLTDVDGWFRLPAKGYTQWVTVRKLGFIPRTRAAAPGVPVLIRISVDDGRTIVLNFTGDAMFGRRFFDMNSDGDLADGILPVTPSVVDHARLLEPIAALLRDADLTAINLESVVNSQPYFSANDPRPIAFHPTKDYVYATHPNALAAMLEDGINVIGLGNNHVYDMLDSGMRGTLDSLDALKLPHFGAGMNETQAWTPAVITVKGQKIAFIGCTTIIASGAEPMPGEITYTASDELGKGGAAHCEQKRLRNAVINAKKNADLVVVMIHGGTEYNRILPQDPVRFSMVAREAGALLVVNHHPHVVSGFAWDQDGLIARSLGNFISDQTIWPSLESYLLTVYVRDGRVVRAFVEPVMIQDNVARGLASGLADYVTRHAAGLERGPFVLESGAMEVDINRSIRMASRSFLLEGESGTLIQIPDGMWVSDFQGDGALRLGRDLLWVGGFENTMVNDTPSFVPLWGNASTASVQTGPEFAYQGQGGVRLLRVSANTQDTITTNQHRILVKPGSQITVSGMYRASNGALPTLQVSWFPDTFGPSSDKFVQPLPGDQPSVWRSFQFGLTVPENIAALQVFLKLSPPASGSASVDFDNIRIVEWSPALTPEFGPLYNFAWLTGQGTVTLSQAVLPGGEDWLDIKDLDLSPYLIEKTP